MQDNDILTSRASQIASQINTKSSLTEEELQKLIEHSQWQTEHIKAIEAHNQWQAEHINAIEAHSQWQAEHIQAIETHNEWQSQHIASLEAQPSYSNGLVPHLPPTVAQATQPTSHTTIYPNASAPSNNTALEQNMLGQIQQNTLFLQNIVAQQLQQQQKTLEKREKKVAALQNSVSWQITGPIRSGQKLVNGVSKVSSTATQGVSKVQAYINQRPKLKDNLMRMTGLKDLYTQKDAISNKKK